MNAYLFDKNIDKKNIPAVVVNPVVVVAKIKKSLDNAC